MEEKFEELIKTVIKEYEQGYNKSDEAFSKFLSDYMKKFDSVLGNNDIHIKLDSVRELILNDYKKEFNRLVRKILEDNLYMIRSSINVLKSELNNATNEEEYKRVIDNFKESIIKNTSEIRTNSLEMSYSNMVYDILKNIERKNPNLSEDDLNKIKGIMQNNLVNELKDYFESIASINKSVANKIVNSNEVLSLYKKEEEKTNNEKLNEEKILGAYSIILSYVGMSVVLEDKKYYIVNNSTNTRMETLGIDVSKLFFDGENLSYNEEEKTVKLDFSDKMLVQTVDKVVITNKNNGLSYEVLNTPDGIVIKGPEGYENEACLEDIAELFPGFYSQIESRIKSL